MYSVVLEKDNTGTSNIYSNIFLLLPGLSSMRKMARSHYLYIVGANFGGTKFPRNYPGTREYVMVDAVNTWESVLF
jgi:hypothetical protein